ncbi:MAG TPA: hypothetical protein VIH86_00965, partial [Puia sp.]
LTNGQLVIGSTGAVPTANTLTAGSGVSITNGPGSITIGLSGSGGVTWVDVIAAGPTPLVANTGYVADVPAAVAATFSLPATPSFGDTYHITGRKNGTSNTGGWIISITTQTIIGGTATAAVSVTSTNQQDSIIMVCTHASGGTSEFTFIDMVGNLTFA